MRHVSPEHLLGELKSLVADREPPTSDHVASPPPFAHGVEGPGSFRLDGASGYPGLGDRSFAGHSPLMMVTLDDVQAWHVSMPERGIWAAFPFEVDAPLRVFESLTATVREPSAEPARFDGAFVGYLTYEFGERLLGVSARPPRSPLAMFGFHDRLATRDGNEWRIDTSGLRPHADVAGWGAELPAVEPDLGISPMLKVLGDSFGRENYHHAFNQVQAYIAAGDIYQANLTRMLMLDVAGTPAELYTALRRSHPAPFASHLVEPSGASLVGISPELFLRATDRALVTEPIKGTRPRGATPDEDAALREELMASTKDAAELVMIVDLMRNDLGRVAEVGSVSVPELKRLDTHRTLFHLSGRVEAQLAEERTVWDALASAVPAGSITGAPKQRAVEILDELEPHTRGVYTGSVGIVDLRGGATFNVAIRTMRVVADRGWLGVGGGIVADSEWEAEFQESADKARAFLDV